MSKLAGSGAVVVATAAWAIISIGTSVRAREITLDQALEIALKRTTRGEMIEGNREVAEQLYSARRINMYVPEISINGSIPSYRKSTAYQPFSNPLDRQPFRSSRLDFNSFIELKQTLVTGGSLTATADLVSEDEEYPDTRYNPEDGIFVNQYSKQGSFRFVLAQPLFRPSSVKNELNNRKDDLAIAEVTRIEEIAQLKKEVVEAYLGYLQQSLEAEMAAHKLRKATLQEEIDSLKFVDEVLSEEDYLLSSSSRLDAELEGHSTETDLGEKKRELATLLDWDVNESFDLVEPEIGAHLDESAKAGYIAAWEMAAPIRKAEHRFAKSQREADYAAAGHGLTGDLNASYAFGQQKIETDRVVDLDGRGGNTQEDINTNAWTLAVEFKLPLWDGGAGGAAVRAAQYQSEQARYEFTRAQRSAQATIVNLINQLDVSYQRVGIIRKQIELAKNRLDIAGERFEAGRISELTLLESKIFLLETRDRYLEEMRQYLLNRIDLESQYLD
jgi:outer membrane protein TolC